MSALLYLLPAWTLMGQVSDPNTPYTVGALAAPAVGQTAVDPNFGVTVRRLSERGSMGGLATAEYPQLQAINSDETRILLSTDVDYRVMDIANLNISHQGLDLTMPRWSPVESDVLWAFDRRSGGTIHLQRHELIGGGQVMTSDLVDVTALGYTSLELGSWEEGSADGRYLSLYGVRNGANTAAVLDLMTGQIRASVAADNVDWAAVSPSGAYLAVQYATRGTGNTDGLVIYDASNGNRLGHAADHHEHGDLGRNAQNADIFLTIAYTDFCANGAVPCCSLAPLPDAIESNALDNLYELGAGTHTSCRNLQRPGFCVHADELATPGQDAFAQEIWLTRLADGGVLRLFHHRSSACSYYLEPRPTISPTGRYVLFTSDWAAPNCNDQGDLYLIDTQPFLDAFLAAVPPPPDAGVVDSGGPPPNDAGQVDTGVPNADGGGPSGDAGAIGDGGNNPAVDGGVSPNNDGGSSAGGDGGVEDGPATSGGCGCAETRRPSSSPWALAPCLLVIVIVGRRRGRDRDRGRRRETWP